MSSAHALEVSNGFWMMLIGSIPVREYEIRTDLRAERVFTVDPPTTKDLDDALSVKGNDDGTYTVGVHIADVSYFCQLIQSRYLVIDSNIIK